jgi:hypothetical protein
MIDPERYLNPDGTYDWDKFDQLTESEQISIKKTWDVCDWQRWYDRFGYWTLDEFNEILKQINIEVCCNKRQLNKEEFDEFLNQITNKVCGTNQPFNADDND